MAHRALTLKYRPQVFADLIGQDHVSSVLLRAIETGRVAQAYLFTGARGVGKTTSARILAKALNCETRVTPGKGKPPGPEPCNACTSCQEIASGVSLDVVEIDGASNRGIADVQSLREKVRFAPTGGRYRVVIIDEVHQLSADAFAALLKTLEEPPPHLVFIFATTDPQKLPDTIRSRTQRFDFARVPLRKVADRLLEIQRRESADADGVRFTLGDGAALLIAHKGEGSMRDSVSALDQVVSAGESEIHEDLVRRVLGIPDREAFFALGGAIASRDPRATLAALHQAFDKGLDPRELAEGLAEHFRHVLVLAVDPERGGELVADTAENLARLRQQGEGWVEADLLRLVRIAAEVQWPMRDSPHPLVHLEAAVLQMATLEPAETLAALLARLEALERRLGGAPGAAPVGGKVPSRGTAPGAPARGGVRAGAFGGASPSPAAAPAPRPAAPGGWSAPGAPRASAAPAVAPAPRGNGGPPPARAEAPPAMAPAARTAVADATDPVLEAADEAQWKQAIGLVNGRKRMLGAFLEESRFLGLAGDAVVLGMDDLHRAVVDVAEHRAMVCEELSRVFGRALDLRCVSLPEGAAPRRLTTDDVKPMIDRAIQLFDGEVVDRRDRGERG
jgi:DNA polymerase-3 subunit gamma/tau